MVENELPSFLKASEIDNEQRDIFLVKSLNTRDGMLAICQAIMSKQKSTGSSEEEILEDCKSFIKKVFAKKCSMDMANEYASMICASIKKELMLQRAFAVLDDHEYY